MAKTWIYVSYGKGVGYQTRARMVRSYRGEPLQKGSVITTIGVTRLDVVEVNHMLDDKTGRLLYTRIECVTDSPHEIPLLIKSGWWEAE